MGIDYLSPIAPAFVNALLVPAGRIQKQNFAKLVGRLQQENVVRLGDVSPDGQSNKSSADLFSPLAFADGRVVYDFALSETRPLSVETFPFELNREPQVVLYLVEGSSLVPGSPKSTTDEKLWSRESVSSDPNTLATIQESILVARSQYRHAILHQLVVFDSVRDRADPVVSKDVLWVSSLQELRTTTIKTVMCDLTARLLHAMDDLVTELQQIPTIEAPLESSKSKYASSDIAARVHARMSIAATPNQGEPERSSLRHIEINRGNRGTTPTGRRSPIRHSIASPSRSQFFPEASSGRDSRDVSRDRSSVAASILNPADKKRNRSAARMRIVLGALSLQAGLWPDAMRNLAEGTATARSNSDHVWHAKGLECIVACMLMYGWAGMYFQIPHICYPLNEKPPIMRSPSGTPFMSTPELASYGGSADNRTLSLHYLTKQLPELCKSIDTLYSKALNLTQDALPQFLMSESVLRQGFTLSALLLRNGKIDDEMIRALVTSKPVPKAALASRNVEGISHTRSEIAAVLMRAIPEIPQVMPLSDLLQIFVGLSSVLSSLGMDRKQVFVLRELLQKITPALVEARKAGAAEMGIHPAAGLLSLSKSSHAGYLRIEEGMQTLLTYVGAMYGALHESELSPSKPSSHTSPGVSESRRQRLQQHGSFGLKIDVLKSCIAICEVLPDFQGVLRYTVHLLDLSKTNILLPLNQLPVAPSISQEEQIKLVTGVKRAVSAADKLGIPDVRADYWDDFLVRSIEPREPSAALRLSRHAEKDLQTANRGSDVKDPFIYNPYLSKQTSKEDEQPLVAGEAAYFAVCLQNPFEFEVEIEEISLLTEGCDFAPAQHSIVLGHLCCQKFTMAGTPTSDGTLKVLGCRAKVRYCRQRDFAIFSKDWRAKGDSNTSSIRFGLGRSSGQDTPGTVEEPPSEMVSLQVLKSQPVVSLQSTALSQPALMVLEGERRSFDITLKNQSPDIAVDLILFTFQDSATKQLRDALVNNELSPVDRYELQSQLTSRSPLKQVADTHSSASISPGGSGKFTIVVLGIPGLLECTVQVDYAHLGVAHGHVKEKFYTRQLSFRLAVTVNAGIEVLRCNLHAFSPNFAWSNKERPQRQVAESPTLSIEGASMPASSSTSAGEGQLTSLLARLGLGSHGDDHCLLLLDVRNVWPFPLSISVQIRENPRAASSPSDSWRRAYTVHESLLPGHVSRVILLVPRFFVPDPHGPIPLLGSQRQFVVSASKPSAEVERANREAFWYREELLKHVRASWKEDGDGRAGSIDLRRGIRLNSRMIEILRIEDVEINLSIEPSSSSDTATAQVRQVGRSHFALQANSFATLIVRVHNRSRSQLHLSIRIQPSLRDQPHNIALDLSKRFAWTGMLQKMLHPPLAPGESREDRLGIMALCTGAYEIGTTVEEFKIPLRTRDKGKGEVVSLEDRRIWHAREPCLLDVI